MLRTYGVVRCTRGARSSLSSSHSNILSSSSDGLEGPCSMGFDCWRWYGDLRHTRGVWTVVSLRHSQQSAGAGDASHLAERRKGKLTLGSLHGGDAPQSLSAERRKGRLTLGSLKGATSLQLFRRGALSWEACSDMFEARLRSESCAMLLLLTVCLGDECGSCCSELEGESERRAGAQLVDGNMPGCVSGVVRTRGQPLWFIKTTLSSGLGRSFKARDFFYYTDLRPVATLLKHEGHAGGNNLLPPTQKVFASRGSTFDVP